MAKSSLHNIERNNHAPSPDFNVLKTVARNQLIHLLESVAEPKDLVLDDDLMRPLDRIIGASVLKEHGVSAIYKLVNKRLIQGASNRLYLFRPNVENAVLIANQIREDQLNGQERNYRLIMVPRQSAICEKILEREGVYASVSFDEFNLELLCLDSKILSMEYPRFFKEYFVDNNFGFMSIIANSLVTLEGLFGTFPLVHTFGRCAKNIFNIKVKLQEDFSIREGHRVPSEMSTLILIDREIDYISALLSPLTYEGLLDDHFRIESGTVEFDSALTGQSKSVKWILNSQDEIFKEIRDRHFASVFSFLSTKAKEIQAIYNRKNDLKSVSDMRTFVSTHLKGTSSQHRSLGLHIAACEAITRQKSSDGDFENQLRSEHNLVQGTDLKLNQQFIEESIMRCFPVVHILRLLCLYSVTYGGIPHRLFSQMKTEFIQSFGYEHMVTFYNLKRAALLWDQPESSVNLSKVGVRKSRFATLAKNLNLLPVRNSDCDLKNPKDVSYLSNGAYIPLSYRLIEQILTSEKLPGFSAAIKSLDYCQYQQDFANKSAHCDRNVLVFFLGGCSYTELSALTFLSRLLRINIIVGSTAFCSGEKFFSDLTQQR